jgi:hypothetical protein
MIDPSPLRARTLAGDPTLPASAYWLGLRNVRPTQDQTMQTIKIRITMAFHANGRRTFWTGHLTLESVRSQNDEIDMGPGWAVSGIVHVMGTASHD